MFQRLNERKVRGATQRLYLIEETHSTDDEENITFAIMGTTCNVYDVRLLKDDAENRWSCTCPDHTFRGNICKHIYFIRDRVLACDKDNWWTVGLQRIANRQQQIDQYQQESFYLSVDSVVEAYQRKKQKLNAQNSAAKQKEKDQATSTVEQREYIGSSCCICLEKMTDACKIVWCQTTCGNTVHADCFEKWQKRQNNACPFCRCPLKEFVSQKRKREPQEYINLGKALKS